MKLAKIDFIFFFLEKNKKKNNYGNKYQLEVLAEIIVRLQEKDKKKVNGVADAASQPKPQAKIEQHVINAKEVIYFTFRFVFFFFFAHIKICLNEKYFTDVETSQTQEQTPPSLVPEYIPHMTIEEAENLQLHDFIDHRDEVGRYLYASIVEKLGSRLKIHYEGWGRRWDSYNDYKKEIKRFAKARTISARPAHRFINLKKGDFVDINPKMRYPGWVAGEIRRKDKKSGQVQVVYEKDNKFQLIWVHLDDVDSIAEFMSKSGQVQKTQTNLEKQISDPNTKKTTLIYQLHKGHIIYKENEVIDNKYAIGDWLEVQDLQSSRWIPGNVIDKENNWIVVHFDGFSRKFDQKLHVVQMKAILREFESKQIDLEIKDDKSENKLESEKEEKQENDSFIELKKGLKSIGLFDKYISIFEKYKIDDSTLSLLDEQHLKEITELTLGDRIKFANWLKNYQLSLRQLKNNDDNDQISEIHQEPLCVCCYEKPVNMVFIPCGHVSMCESCSKQRKDCNTCVICAKEGTTLKIFKSI
ncbi:hypothetical protein RFI_28626 [Reticulomyxa filosa]|uniref:RING-type domain-containing protein n=1 Tax=Reticulomyxa filosa TaxID=46433 RepID=X6M444_RETFI|nr:hypothetical protein RFI_28626 [Reticulomyxa filosa]|eukprot:ETO08763.1 hypothetical protein RFI_28626 [Reticulomyxa filosa]